MKTWWESFLSAGQGPTSRSGAHASDAARSVGATAPTAIGALDRHAETTAQHPRHGLSQPASAPWSHGASPRHDGRDDSSASAAVQNTSAGTSVAPRGAMSVTTDQADYAPGSTATFTVAGVGQGSIASFRIAD